VCGKCTIKTAEINMYLKNIAIKNIGPIEDFVCELPFKENGEPKPVIFVGENGSGRTFSCH
jgi:signal recognition particle GTPase